MSKRFGRNQRRALSAQVAELADKAAYETDRAERYIESDRMNRELLSHNAAKVEELTQALRDIAEVLGPHFYGLPAVIHTIDQIYPGYRYRLPKPLTLAEVMPLSSRDLCELVTHAVYELQAISATVRRDKIMGDVHVLLETPDGRKAYAVSQSAWHQLRRDPKRMRQEFLPMIADELARFIAGGER